MTRTSDSELLDVLLDSWDRNNAILVNLLREIPEDALEVRATQDSPSVAEMFSHIHYVRMVFVSEDVPESAGEVPAEEWKTFAGRERMAEMLDQSATIVRAAVKSRIESGRTMDLHYDHPLLLLQHMIWHEGYHHGQIKLVLKRAGQVIPDERIGALTWDVWMTRGVRAAPAAG